MLKGKKIFISLSFILMAAALATPVSATTFLLQNIPCAHQSTDATGLVTTQACGLCDLIQVVVNATNMLAGLSSVVALLMFIYAGIRMATSYINPAFVQKAKDTMKYAVMGLLLVFGAYTIVNVLIMAFYGGSSDFGGLYKVTGQQSWGVCSSEVRNFNSSTDTTSATTNSDSGD